MPALDYVIQCELLELLTPVLGNEQERRGLLQLALGAEHPLLSRLDYTGPAEIFILKAADELTALGELKPGQPALWAWLEEISASLRSPDQQARLAALQPLLNPTAGQTSLLSPLRLQVFLASPGDVADERNLAREVLEQLSKHGEWRGRVEVEAVAWDKPGAGVPMLVTMTPQEAITQGLPKPSKCDIVIVIFWSRMGTPLPPDWVKPEDKSPYRSGTEWEYFDALQAAKETDKPEILVYRRTERPLLDPEDPELNQKLEQWRLVKDFFQSFVHPDGWIIHSHHPYAAPADFKQQLELHLRELIRRRIGQAPPVLQPLPSDWSGSPFPGLRAFTPADAPIFFGRDRETDGLIHRLAQPDSRFLIVVGASGSGKSSLVAAGLIPRLLPAPVAAGPVLTGAIEGSQDWGWVRFTPGGAGDNPCRALAEALVAPLPLQERRAYDLEQQLRADSQTLARGVEAALQGKPAWAELLLFIDQFEELFTVIKEAAQQESFIALLATGARLPRLRIVATVRADFYARCVESPVLAELLRTGSYPLAAPGLRALFEMLAGPAARAGLTFEAGLITRILEDTGTEPGALALMAFALQELYEQCPDGLLTHAAYDGFGGVQGAIAQRAETVFSQFATATQAVLNEVFQELIEIDDRGIATRRRAALQHVRRHPAATELVTRFTNARLLVTSEGEDHQPQVEVAHEALLRSWPRLADWIETVRGDLWLQRQLQLAVKEWEQHCREPNYLWPSQRVMREARDMLQRLHPSLSAAEEDFLGCPLEPEPMLAEIDDPATPHERRALIGVRLALIGDTRKGVGLRPDGLPDIAWCQVPGGEITLEIEAEQSSRFSRWLKRLASPTFKVEPFCIARYPVTYIQYRAFLDDPEGYHNPVWWQGLSVSQPPAEAGKQFNQYDNHPAENVAWVEAVPFCRWLSARLGYEIRLPTEWEWQQAATGGNPANVYPWGPDWGEGRANTYESGLQRSTAVGMYPHGASPVGALDMSGNLWEWCLNKYDDPRDTDLGGDARRVLRGGSWYFNRFNARAAYRFVDTPRSRYSLAGWRLACSSPIL